MIIIFIILLVVMHRILYLKYFRLSTNCLLFSTGSVACVPALKYILKCNDDYTYWPYDQQTCHIELAFWTAGVHFDFQLEGNGVCTYFINFIYYYFIMFFLKCIFTLSISFISNKISKK